MRPLQVSFYERFRQDLAVLEGLDNDILPLWQTALIGFTAAGLASVLTHPLDTVKTLQMVDSEYGKMTVGSSIVKLYREEGAAGFFRGAAARVMLVSAAGLIFFWANESVKRILG
mmetsp:Transcript_5196/g.12203  ORF Transcript_5196/g.12203 Transcript_5196/m.12203 type:complete len:115 (-) Transcript_5196:1344-1688(-)